MCCVLVLEATHADSCFALEVGHQLHLIFNTRTLNNTHLKMVVGMEGLWGLESAHEDIYTCGDVFTDLHVPDLYLL